MSASDRDASFEQVVLPHLEAGYNLARWVLRNDHDDGDFMQEAMVRAFRFFDGFSGKLASHVLRTIVLVRAVFNCTPGPWIASTGFAGSSGSDESENSEVTEPSCPTRQLRRSRCAMAFALLATACAGQWHSRIADKPLTHGELSSRALSIVDDAHDPTLYTAFARALAKDGFTVVQRPPYHEDLEVTLSIARKPASAVALATLRSDGFFIEVAEAPLDGANAAEALASTLALAQGTADFFRNGGTPQQKGLSGQ